LVVVVEKVILLLMLGMGTERVQSVNVLNQPNKYFFLTLIIIVI
jgi:hypothetical protein